MGADAPQPVEAKLALPRTRPGVVARPRLFDALDRLDAVELTVLAAPAGAGKTVLLGSWLAGRPDLTPAWVTLEPGDDDPVRLWTLLAQAADRVQPGVARRAFAQLRTPRSAIEPAIDELLSALARYRGRIVLVLDDLHHVRGQGALRSLAYAFERLPGAVRVVAATRSDPAIRFGRLRGRGGLRELRAKDLAFTPDEAKQVLGGTLGNAIDDTDVKLIVDRTEGWPAGVSLAALWLAEVGEPSHDIRQFSADQRHVADYLTSEVLDVLGEDTRDFLLRTSVLGRFTAQLCDAVLGTTGAAQRLSDLERSNLFLVPLHIPGGWYRYHHLFGELLRIQLNATDPESIPELHRRAAGWFASHDLVEEALEHTAATGNKAAVADLLLAQHRNLIWSGAFETLTTWLDRVPETDLEQRPLLAAVGAFCGGLLAHPAARRQRLAAIAERGVTKLPDAQRRYVECMLAVTRAVILDCDLTETLDRAHRAVDLAQAQGSSQGNEFGVGTLAMLGYALYLDGDLDAARRVADEALARPEARKRPHGLIYAHATHALLECRAGRPRAAQAEAEHAVGLSRELGLAGVWSAGLAHHALGQALLSLGLVRDAERELERADVLLRAPEPRLDHAHTLLALVEARIARGRLTLARAELDAAWEQIRAFADAGRLPDWATQTEQALAQALIGGEHPVDPPSPAELAVLRLLASELSQREIGDELFLSVNTVKTHTRSLYAKLGVGSRTDAVHKASALGLVEITDSPG